MPVYLLNFFFRFSGYTFGLKQKIVRADSWLIAAPYALLLIFSELGFMLVSLPVYLFVSPGKIQEEGFIFPRETKDASLAKGYAIRRKITLTTLFGAGGVFVLKLLLIAIVSSYLFGAQKLLADTQDWTFSLPSDYSYDASKIEITSGVAQLKDIGFITAGSTTNPGFTTNTTGWTYADWGQGGGEVNITGARQGLGGNPGGWINISAPAGSSDELGGYWRQGFTTSVANPTTTVSFDWQVSAYDSTPTPFTFKLYVFVDTGTGVPVIGQEVWSSAEITGTSGWASVSNLDVSSKVTAAGTYYLKVAVWIETNTTSGGPYTVGYDNVQLDWTKTTHLYDTNKATTTPIASLVVDKAVSWNSFTETATKNGGEIYYQISSDNGVNWKWWAGSAWATTTSVTDYNIASVVNANLNAFATSSNQIKWRAYMSSDGTQQVVLDNIAIGYTQNQRPSIANLAPAQATDNGNVQVNYNMVDAESDPSSLSAYEYSLDGSNWTTMTASTTDPAHNGVSGLISAPAGVAHTFVWDAKSQLGNIYYASVYARLRPNDGIGNGFYATSSTFSVDYATSTVSNVAAVQNAGTTTVAITYDLFDDTTDNILVEMEISGDGGATWAVATNSAIGAIGSGINSGNGKLISWNAGVDYPGQQKNNLQVRIRAKDKYQNQGNYASSSNFSLDTLAPATLSIASLLAQPNAGDTTVLVSASFTETNPNFNEFYIALNGGAYGAATAGDVNTATPSNQNTNVGATLDGNDYISKVEAVHTDDYGSVGTNENTSPNVAYKYVKPYTPPAPTLNNPVTNRLDLLINPHAGEASDLEYAIYEASTTKYVQGDGTLGDDPVWQTRGTGSGQWGNGLSVTGKIRITGLVSPVSLYSFKVKSRNPSDAAHAISSESAWSAEAAIPNTAPTISLGASGQTTDGTQYVDINYTGTDGQGDINNIVSYEYSTDNSVWQTMTEKGGVGSSGISSLVFLPTGSAYKFSWNSGLDMSDTEDSTVYVRLRSNDAQLNGNLAVSSAFEIDNRLPVISNVSASQNAGAKTVAIDYDLSDANNSSVQIEISADGGSTWNVATSSATGAVGSGVTPGTGKSISWNAGADFNGQYNMQMKVRVRARDAFGNQGAYAESSDFSVDTHAPVLANVTAVQDSGADTFTFHYDVTEDVGNAAVSLEISSNGGSTWVVPTASASGDMGSVVPGSGKTITWNGAADYNDQEKTAMRIRLTAADSFTNSFNLSSADFSLDTQAPRLTNVTGAQILASTSVLIHYDLADLNNSEIALDISSDGGSNWIVADTSVTGDVGVGIASGANKTIVWSAAADFPDQDLTTMRVRVRGIDVYNNVSGNTSSANFSLDTLPPAVNVAAELQAQPLAGATAVLIGGSFTETHPDANDFYVALNGGAYGAATVGGANTASPVNQLTAAATLDGNDYVSQIKIIHTDDYGQNVANENSSPNSAYKYVKPYTPAAPTVNNPGIGTVDVLINKNAAETDGLEYAIYEASTTKYVQGDGTLGNSPVWQTLGTGAGQWGQSSGTPGKIGVNGLTTHSYLYQFQVKSRNTSDAAHAASSESVMSSGASSANQSPTITLNSVGQTVDGTRYVIISYIGSDLESEIVSLVKYQYSTNGSTWSAMTEKGGVGSDGVSGLSFNYPSTAHDFMWDAGADLISTEDDTVYIRLQANDSTSDGGIAPSAAFTIDTKNPVISAPSASQDASSNNVSISYSLTDISNSYIELQVSSDGGTTWNVATSTANGDVGADVVPDSGELINWNPGVDYSGQEDTDVRVRLRALDNFGNQGGFASSANFSVDTKSPIFANIGASQNVGNNTVSITYDISDANSSEVALDISSDGGSTWAVTDTSVVGAIGAGIAPGTGKTITWNAGVDFAGHEISNMRVRLRATDAHNNATGNVESANFSLDTLAPAISGVEAVQAASSDSVGIGYDLSDSGNVAIIIDISADSGSTWTVATSTLTGAVGNGVTPGLNKSAAWNAGVDYDNQQNTAMKVRIRGIDSFNNISAPTELPGLLAVDTLAPVADILADLKIQPNAGETVALIGGSFTEANPSINDFLVAVSGGAYGATTTGQINTAAPTDQNTAIGSTLTGHDYISKVKLVHLDNYGHWGVNENTSPNVAYKYVKPYAPAAPTVDNPQNDSVELTINPHVSEASDLQYAIYEVSTGKYVQTDGSLGTSPIWKTLGTASGQWGNISGVSSRIKVIGLSSPVATYSFMVKSRNPSDVAHAVSSESAYSPVAGIINTAPGISISAASQIAGGNYAVIDYVGTDAQNDTNALDVYEYSIDGSVWSAMTEKSGVGSDSTGSLIFHATGTAYMFAWDVANDLPNQEQATVYIRLRSTDGLASSNLAVSSAFYTDTRGPIISNLTVSQAPAAGVITFEYDLDDSAGADNDVVLEISDDNGATYSLATTTLSGDVGGGITAGINRTATWNASVDFAGQESSAMRVRLRASDHYGNLGDYLVSGNFSVDAKAPVVSAVSASQTVGSGNVVINYTLADNTPAGHLVEFAISDNSGSTWTVATTTRSGEIGAGQTTGVKSFIWQAGTDFSGHDSASIKARVRAKDYFDNQGAYAASADFALDTLAPVISNMAASQALATTSVTFMYDLNEDAIIFIDISADGGSTWSVSKDAATGDLGTVSAGSGKAIAWDAAADFNGQENSVTRFRLRGVDSFDNSSIYFESSDFAVDTAAPLGLLSLSKFSSTATSATLVWQSNSDANFHHYELWHGANLSDVNNQSGTAASWGVAEDSGLNDPLTVSTVLVGIDLSGDYYVKIWAIDDFGNMVTAPAINLFEIPPPPTVTVSGALGGAAIMADTFPPVKPILSPLDTPTRETEINVSGLAEPRSKVELYDNGALVGTLRNLADSNGVFDQNFRFLIGRHALSVRSIDDAGNASAFSDITVLDIVTATPMAPIILTPADAAVIVDATPLIIGVADPDNQIILQIDNDRFDVQSDGSGAWSFILPSAFSLSDGPHTISASARDAAGNESLPAVYRLTKITIAAPSPVSSPVTVSVPGPSSVSGPGPEIVSLPSTALISETTEATELPGIPVPKVMASEASVTASGDILSFTGTSLPDFDVVVYIHSDQALVYRARADADGNWRINHSQAVSELAPGDHTIYAVALDTDAKIKSRPSAVSSFTVERSFWVMAFNLLNWQTTAISLAFLILVIFWLHRLRNKKK